MKLEKNSAWQGFWDLNYNPISSIKQHFVHYYITISSGFTPNGNKIMFSEIAEKYN